MKKILFYTVLTGLIFSAVSCKKWLDLKPQDGIVREEFWQTKEQVEAAVTGIYSSLLASTDNSKNPPDFVAPAELFFLWGEARADMVSPGFAANAPELDMVNMNIQPTNPYANWRPIYQTINYCNTVIELAPGVLQKDNTFSQEQLNRAVGEAKAIRALMYFYLARTFRDVPLKLDATTSDENITPIAKSTSDVVLAQVVQDLKDAEPNLPLTYGNINWDKGRVTRYTVNAILADVYLWTEKYAECQAECDKIINSGRFGLIGGGQDLFNELYYDGNSTESIFELQFNLSKLNPFYNMHQASTRRWTAAPHLMDQVFGQDDPTTVVVEQDRRGAGTSLRASDFTIWKYIGATATTLRTSDQSFAHWIFYRYADVLLMKAEAINQLDKSLEASRLVKTIRDRANAFDFNGTMDSTTKQGMEEYILQERQREFAFEGKRWYDVLRNAKRNNYQNLKYLLDVAAISIPADRQQAAFNKIRDHNSHYLPIYLYELQTNKLLVQNPFYK
ncbi:RagB/SusD family nutrient uptake outer membrane protein [Flavisolibacter ginsenosidimutans]|uniref:RagB/SusD family nutrient uptake outer membrane protein n=1 Tax=Flavisolibacter ginsenosidimutans TaxID=661481 RepID=A0A5B8UFH8_9BACT|nr:RagB/SusD family nutrient uptake outer membrane protein [Flavisolibacter ginsenosidimutans]QEC55417.1 RagB/SusD family nutrient uptake outer membrane protein [Flavisolibacter ginsenosidimutans]